MFAEALFHLHSVKGYWASVLYAYFASLGLLIITEDATNIGNIDMTLLVKNHVYIFEFKVVGKSRLKNVH